MNSTTSAADAIAALQQQFVVLGQNYAAALRQCEQGLQLAPGEELVNATRINNVVNETLKLVDGLPDEEKVEESETFENLAKKDAKLDQELLQAKLNAEKALEKIKLLRRNVAEVVLNNS